MHRHEGATLTLDAANIRSRVYLFIPPTLIAGDAVTAERQIRFLVQKMKEDGYRTIVLFLHDPLSEILLLADAAEEFEMNRGEHLWIFVGYFDGSFTHRASEPQFANVTKLLSGAAFVMEAENSLLDPAGDRFLSSWLQQDATFVERVNSFNPIDEGEPGYFHAEENFFQTHVLPEFGAGFLYDAIMSIGIGACLAAANVNNGAVSGLSHLEGVRSVDFHGASDNVIIGTEHGITTTFGRRESTVAYVASNILPPKTEGQERYVSSVWSSYVV
jgi:hypothetical protein